MSVRMIAVLALLTSVACSGNKAEPDSPPIAEPAATEAQEPTMLTEDLTFEAAGIVIHGTLTRPAGDGPFPGVVVAAGSGPTDRDWKSPMLPGDNGSGELLGAALAERGIALLRYDKRGTGATGMPPAPVKWGDYVAELDAGVAALAAKGFIDPAKLYVAGHSEGGTHALRTAASPSVPLAGVILLSAAGRSLRDVVLWQIGNQIAVSGLNPAAQKAEMDALTKALDLIGAGETVNPQDVGQLQGVQQFIMALQNPQSVDFARGLLTFDPLAAFAAFDLPVLVLSGDRDIQIDPKLDAKPLAEASKAAGRPTTFVIAEGADHVLKHEPRPMSELDPSVGFAYNADGRELSGAVADAIASFVK